MLAFSSDTICVDGLPHRLAPLDVSTRTKSESRRSLQPQRPRRTPAGMMSPAATFWSCTASSTSSGSICLRSSRADSSKRSTTSREAADPSASATARGKRALAAPPMMHAQEDGEEHRQDDGEERGQSVAAVLEQLLGGYLPDAPHAYRLLKKKVAMPKKARAKPKAATAGSHMSPQEPP